MPDYIYLLENRLSSDQQNAIRHLREAAREAGLILFLTGDAVRDLTSGHAVRDLEVVVQGSALKLKKTIIKLGGKIWGEDEFTHSLYLCFPGTVRIDLVSAHRLEYPKPAKPVYHAASIQEDLRRRDFTVNAMAISLNEGSYGLFMDPLNGAADIESRTLRLVSNYGFLDEPTLLLRAVRYAARLGWEMDPRTRMRYDNAKEEGVISLLSMTARSRELEQIGHEEDGLKVIRAYEHEGWMQHLFPAWTSAKADEEKLKKLHELAVELLLQGVTADISSAQMQLLTAKLQSKDLAALKKHMLRPGFVDEWNSLDAIAAEFSKVLLAKVNATPSVSYKLFKSYDPEAILWLGFTNKTTAVRDRFELFLKTWPEMRQRIPHALMQEMRITPELAAYQEITGNVFLQLIDGKLATAEEMKVFLEPFSPPPPPPQVTIKRPRMKRGAEIKLKEHAYDGDNEDEDAIDEDSDLDDLGTDNDTLADEDAEMEMEDEAEVDTGRDLEEPKPSKKSATKSVKPIAPAKPQKPHVEKTKAAKVEAKPLPAPTKKAIPAKPVVPAKKKAVPTKSAPAKPVKVQQKQAPKTAHVPAKSKATAGKAPAKKPVKTPTKLAKPPAKKVAAKPIVKKIVTAIAKRPASKAVKHGKPLKSAKPTGKKTAKKR